MLPHHADSLRRVTGYFQASPDVLALVLGGSLAHGFAGPASDIDVLILVSEAEYARRAEAGQLHFFDQDLCTYPEGYVDGKYLDLRFVQQVAERGSDPARFAFQGAQVLFSRLPGLDAAVAAAACYPEAGHHERLGRFYAQFEAWHWYAHEALRLANVYLRGVAVSKLVLFGGRLILAHNQLLYPYHKWFLRVLAQAPSQPAGLLQYIETLCAHPTADSVDAFYQAVKQFRAWPAPAAGWPQQFMQDSELNWLAGGTPIDDE